MERLAVFMDHANIDNSGREHGRIDYAHLLGYLAEGRFLVDGHCYVPIDPRRQLERTRLLDLLWQQGWNVHEKLGKIAGDSYKCNLDVEMAIDMLRVAREVRPDIMLLCSGDEDFLPVVREIRSMGIRVEVAAFEAAAARRLRQQASGFISLDLYYEEYVAGMADGRLPDDEDGEAGDNRQEGTPDDALADLEAHGQPLEPPVDGAAAAQNRGHAPGGIPNAARYL